MQANTHISCRWGWLLSLLLLAVACSKGVSGLDVWDDKSHQGQEYSSSSPKEFDWAVGTCRIREGVSVIHLSSTSVAFVENPEELDGIAAGTRLFLQYRGPLSGDRPSFCTERIHVDWATPIDVGEISYLTDAWLGHPVGIVLDWVTSLEDGFLTLHYMLPTSGKEKHTFTLVPGIGEGAFRLVHNAHGDTEGTLSDGIICFPVEELLAGFQEGQTLSLTYLDLNHELTTLTVVYPGFK